MRVRAKLIFLCGKMAAGKSTLARDLAQRENAVLLVQDELLDRLFPDEITDIPEFVKYSSRLKDALAPHICSLLSKGISVVLDFPGNTKGQRAWFRQLSDGIVGLTFFHLGDAAGLRDMDADPEHRRRFEFPETFVASLAHSEKVISDWTNQREEGPFVFAVRAVSNGELLGGCEIRLLTDHVANLSYWTFRNTAHVELPRVPWRWHARLRVPNSTSDG